MRKLINFERLLRIDRFIRRRGSGPPNEFTKRTGINWATEIVAWLEVMVSF